MSAEKPVLKVELAPKNRVYNNTSIRASAINSNNQVQIAKVDGNEIMITKEVVAKPIRNQSQQQHTLQLQQQQQQQQQDHQREGTYYRDALMCAVVFFRRSEGLFDFCMDKM